MKVGEEEAAHRVQRDGEGLGPPPNLTETGLGVQLPLPAAILVASLRRLEEKGK